MLIGGLLGEKDRHFRHVNDETPAGVRASAAGPTRGRGPVGVEFTEEDAVTSLFS